jgi:hypothetical protein
MACPASTSASGSALRLQRKCSFARKIPAGDARYGKAFALPTSSRIRSHPALSFYSFEMAGAGFGERSAPRVSRQETVQQNSLKKALSRGNR